MTEYSYGVDAIIANGEEAAFDTIRQDILAATRPDTLLESILADEILHATWELERVRDLRDIAGPESFLSPAYNRASRNWHRARRHLTLLQSARTTTDLCGIDEAPPLADPALAGLRPLNPLPEGL